MVGFELTDVFVHVHKHVYTSTHSWGKWKAMDVRGQGLEASRAVPPFDGTSGAGEDRGRSGSVESGTMLRTRS